MATSQNRWPALSASSSLLHTWTVPGADTSLRLRGGSAGFLLVHLATRFDRRVEALKEPLLDDWGYAYRPVRGYETTLSNHSSGTAEDLNATDHPLGVTGTFTPAEAATIHAILDKYDECIRWGGDYQGRKDTMHFEINRDLAACERVARRLLDSPRGKQVLKVNPGQRAVVLS